MTYSDRCHFRDVAIGQIWLDESPVREIDDDIWVDEKLIISAIIYRNGYGHGVVEFTRLDGTKEACSCCSFFHDKTLTKIAD